MKSPEQRRKGSETANDATRAAEFAEPNFNRRKGRRTVSRQSVKWNAYGRL